MLWLCFGAASHAEPVKDEILDATSLLKRAFELAREGVEPQGIRAKLKSEGYCYAMISSHLGGPALCAQLRKVARSTRPGA